VPTIGARYSGTLGCGTCLMTDTSMPPTSAPLYDWLTQHTTNDLSATCTDELKRRADHYFGATPSVTHYAASVNRSPPDHATALACRPS
jgi:hypothetical protein